MIEAKVTLDSGGDGDPKARVLEALDFGLGEAAATLRLRIIDGFKAGQVGRFGSSAPGTPPNVNTGTLSRSITAGRVRQLRWRVGTVVKYGKIHEYGGTIRAKGKKWLTVPVHPRAKDAVAKGQRAKDMNLQFIRGKNGAGLLVKEIKGKRARVEVWFVLKKSVTLPPRPWLRPPADQMAASGELSRIAQAAAKRRLTAQIVQTPTGGGAA